MAQEARKATPPSGVTAPSQCVPVSASRYRLPEKHDAGEHHQTGGRQQGRAIARAEQGDRQNAQRMDQMVQHARLPDGEQLGADDALEPVRAEGARAHGHHEVQCREYRELPVCHCWSWVRRVVWAEPPVPMIWHSAPALCAPAIDPACTRRHVRSPGRGRRWRSSRREHRAAHHLAGPQRGQHAVGLVQRVAVHRHGRDLACAHQFHQLLQFG